MQILVDANVAHTVQSRQSLGEDSVISPLVLGHKAWDHFLLK